MFALLTLASLDDDDGPSEQSSPAFQKGRYLFEGMFCQGPALKSSMPTSRSPLPGQGDLGGNLVSLHKGARSPFHSDDCHSQPRVRA